jgi:putative oxidoreductase
MKVVVLIARTLLGLMFFVFGLNGFVHFLHAPPVGGLAGEFLGAIVASHFSVLIFGVQLVAGILLLSNQFVPLALVLLAPVLVNILTFHITMQPAGLPPGLIATALWFIVALPLRSHFAPIFVRKSTS